MSDPYSRVYWTVIDDDKFDGVREDMCLFGSWLMLLLVADMAYPAPAFRPVIVPSEAFAQLEERGLVDALSGGRYRVHGLAAERERRSESGRNAAALRWQSARIADPMPSKAKQSRAEQSNTRAQGEDDGRADLEAFLLVTFHAPSERQRAFMDAYCRTFDVTGPDRAARLILANPTDPIGAMKRDLEAFRKERSAAAAASEVPQPKPRTGPNIPLLRARHNNGQHTTPEAACPECQAVPA